MKLRTLERLSDSEASLGPDPMEDPPEGKRGGLEEEEAVDGSASSALAPSMDSELFDVSVVSLAPTSVWVLFDGLGWVESRKFMMGT